jgi:GWxTD domain-containing protein
VRRKGSRLYRSVALALLFALGFGAAFAFAQKKKSSRDLEPRYRKWIEEEVVYIITPKEKEVFLQLETDREREIFIEAFWRQRNPDPNSPDNEFRKEHYQRIAQANRLFGRDAPGPGWRTDMGRIHILLGEPHSVERYDTLTEIYPVIIWFYSGMADLGLPNSFNVAFFKKDGIGAYELYSPVRHGPQSLLIHYKGDMTMFDQAYLELRRIAVPVAEVSLSLLPGESAAAVPQLSMASEILIANRIPNAPLERVKDAYAEKLLRYKDIIDVEYTANYIDSEAMIRVLHDPSGQAFVHYLLEPRRLTFETAGRDYRSLLEINGHVADSGGRMVYQFERKIPIEFDQDRIEMIRDKLFSYQDIFPLVEGRYRLSLLFKNVVSREFSSFEAEIDIPSAAAFSMSPITLAHRITRDSKYQGQNKAFLVTGGQLVPSPRNDFASGDILVAHVQVRGLPRALEGRARMEYTIEKEGQPVLTTSRDLSGIGGVADVVQEFPLQDFAPAYYKVRAVLHLGGGIDPIPAEADFYIASVPHLPRPWVLSMPLPASHDPEIANILGGQFLNLKQIDRALELLEKAYRSRPADPRFAMDTSRALLAAGDFARAKTVALSFLGDPPRPEFRQIAGQACQALGEYAEAVIHYKEHLAHFGTHLAVLNAVGECYHRLGDTEEALTAWEKSLEIEPNQEKIRALVDSLKKRP